MAKHGIYWFEDSVCKNCDVSVGGKCECSLEQMEICIHAEKLNTLNGIVYLMECKQ